MTVTLRNDLDAAFEATRTGDRTALMPYLTAGFPDPDEFVDLAISIIQGGADVLEIGIPFSDPLLDGPAIQRSQQAALDAGITPEQCLAFAAEIHERSDTPLFFMGAYNPVFAYGQERFCADAARAGVSGLIIPDLPFEEQGSLRSAAQKHGLHIITMVAPTSTPERLERACAEASGFVYCISVSGVTGAHTRVADAARPLVERIQACTDIPIAVGFGIGTPETARQVGEFADGVIVGTALINLLAETPLDECHREAQKFIAEFRKALNTDRATKKR